MGCLRLEEWVEAGGLVEGTVQVNRYYSAAAAFAVVVRRHPLKTAAEVGGCWHIDGSAVFAPVRRCTAAAEMVTKGHDKRPPQYICQGIIVTCLFLLHA